MKNIQVVQQFLNRREANTQNLRSVGNKLYSYTSLLAEWVNGEIIVYMPIATYSNTSKRHWYYLRTEAPKKLLVLKD